MLKIIKKDITTVESGILAHGVNCQGVMGYGVAKAIKEKWPEVYQLFKSSPTGKSMLGNIRLVKPSGYPNLSIYNCYTQEYYGRDAKVYADLNSVSKSLQMIFEMAHISGSIIHLPKIGCGLGGLDWEREVKPIITRLSDAYDVLVYICEI